MKKTKQLFNLIFVMTLMFIVGMKVSAISVKQDDVISRPSADPLNPYLVPYQTTTDGELVYCTDRRNENLSAGSCELNNSGFNTKQSLAIGGIINRSKIGSLSDMDRYFAATMAINKYLGHLNSAESPEGYIWTGDCALCELTQSYYNYANGITDDDVAELTKPLYPVGSTTLNFKLSEDGKNYVAYFEISRHVAISKMTLTHNGEIKSTSNSKRYEVVIPVDSVKSGENFTVNVSDTWTVNYAKSYSCGTRQPVARLEPKEEKGNITFNGSITIEEPKKGKITITKVDSETGKELSGAKFKLYKGAGCSGTVVKVGGVEEFTVNGTLTITNLTIDGTYYSLKETQAPSGYTLPSDTCVAKTIDLSKNSEVTLPPIKNNKHKPQKIQVIKIDSSTNKNIGGVVLELSSTANDYAVRWNTSDENPKVFSDLIIGKEYQVREISAPEGYILDTRIQKFTVKSNENPDITITVRNTPKPVLKVLKVDSSTGKGLSGAKLQLLASNKTTVIEEWVTNESAHEIKNLNPGTYYLKELEAPAGYLLNSNLQEIKLEAGKTKTIEFENSKNSIRIRKVDEDDKTKYVVGAKLHIEDSSGKQVGKSWITTNKAHEIEKLAAGIYYLVEDNAPDGYVKNTKKQKFEVKSDQEMVEVVMTNKKSEIKISKQDATTGKELPGATLKLTDEKGNKIDEWVSTDKPHVVKGLKDGKYKLTETIAPEGYTLSKKVVEFVVKDGKVDKPVVMTNELTPVPSTGGSRSTLLIFVAMLDIALGIGIITYVRKNRLQS